MGGSAASAALHLFLSTSPLRDKDGLERVTCPRPHGLQGVEVSCLSGRCDLKVYANIGPHMF